MCHLCNRESLQAKKIIQLAVNGKQYGKDDIDDIELLFTWDSKALIDKVKKQTNTIIMADSRVFVITIQPFFSSLERHLALKVSSRFFEKFSTVSLYFGKRNFGMTTVVLNSGVMVTNS
jgi:hypothetical protein